MLRVSFNMRHGLCPMGEREKHLKLATLEHAKAVALKTPQIQGGTALFELPCKIVRR